MNTEEIYEANLEAIAAYLNAGEAEPGDFRLGFELEHFIVSTDTHAHVPYLGSTDPDGSHVPGIIDVLEALAPFYDRRIVQDLPEGGETLLGLARSRAVITLEPGAQLEVSIGPARNVAEIERIYTAFRAELDEVLAPLRYEVVLLGYHPTASARAIPLLPKERYRLMDAHFAQTGRHGICMMRASASTQVSIDFSDEADAIRKFRIANLIGPLLAFLCDNAPKFEDADVRYLTAAESSPAQVADTPLLTTSGLPVPYRMVRTAIWEDVDPDRSMVCPSVFSTGQGYRAYAATIMERPAILTMEPDAVGHGFAAIREIYANRLMTQDDIEHLLSMFFFDVRFKRYLEIRVADALNPALAFAFAALVEGLFYEPRNLDVLDRALAHVVAGDVHVAKHDLAVAGYAAKVYGRNASSWLDELIALADTDANPDRAYLEPLRALVEARRTPLDAFCAEDRR